MVRPKNLFRISQQELIAPNKTAKDPGELPTGMGDGSKSYYQVWFCTSKVHIENPPQ